MELKVRKSAVAGMFYPSGIRTLKRKIRSYLENVSKQELEGELKALIVPHAGYMYSGQVAADAFALLQKWHANRKSDQPVKIILIGPAHTVYLDGIATDGNTIWETPIGQVHTFSNGFTQNLAAHHNEHCLEVEVPFLQEVLDNFVLLPLLTGIVDPGAEAKRILPLIDEHTILIISTDLSHFYDHQTATARDHKTIDAIQNLEISKLENKGDACGKDPVLILLSIAKQLGWNCHLLNYRNSGDVTGQLKSVVGYAAFAFYKS
jgi:AmmeMemoRadiSam system protein B